MLIDVLIKDDVGITIYVPKPAVPVLATQGIIVIDNLEIPLRLLYKKPASEITELFWFCPHEERAVLEKFIGFPAKLQYSLQEVPSRRPLIEIARV